MRTEPGRTGEQYEFLLASLPKELQAKWYMLHTVDLRSEAVVRIQERIEAEKAAVLADLAALEEEWNAASLRAQETGIKRAKALLLVNELVRTGAAKNKTEAVKLAAAETGYSINALWKNDGQVQGYAEKYWPMLLVDMRKGQVKSCHVDIDARFLEKLKEFYNIQSKPAFTAAVRSCCRHIESTGMGIPVPTCSVKTLWRQFNKLCPREAQITKRGNKADWEAEFWPSIQRDRSMLRALEVLNGDGHYLDYWIDFGDGTKGRAVGAFWMDLASNYMFDPVIAKTENSDTIRRGFLDICDRFGVPEKVNIDNGMGYAGKDLSGRDQARKRFKKNIDEAMGIWGLLTVNTIWAKVAHGQAKPIERSFRTIEEELKAFPELDKAYLGNCPDARPDSTRKAVPFEVFVQCVRLAVAHYNTQEGRRSEGIQANGRSYREIWNTKLAEAKALGKPRKMEDWEWKYCVMAGRVISIPKTNSGAFTLNKNRYHDFGLAEWMGKKIQVRFNPDDLREVQCYTLKGIYICKAKIQGKVNYLDKEQLRDYERLQAQRRKLKKALAEVNEQILDPSMRRGATPTISLPAHNESEAPAEQRYAHPESERKAEKFQKEFRENLRKNTGKVLAEVTQKPATASAAVAEAMDRLREARNG
ncbi:MAG: Mu transposase C-terminal domain-containing protein [Pontiellaceae bacterium]|nr:Mu transposase C-terminal domain-containing protein [Pontiellaceae bacterium]